MAILPAELARVAREVPDALRPSWLTETWSGVHGAGGLRAEVDDVHAKLLLTPRGLSGSSSASGVVHDGGREVGTFTRDQTLHPEGRLEVHHSYLKLDGSAQGSGFARAFNDRAFARYAEAGVDDVTILAALSVGGYAWARQGFELIGTGATAGEQLVSRARILTDLVERGRSSGKITADQYAALAPRLYGGGPLPSDALTSVQELAAMPEVGKAVLLGRSWEGIRPIERTRSWWADSAPAGVSAARDGVDYLTRPDLVASASAAAARRIASTLPRAFDPAASGASFTRALAHVGGGAVVDAERGAVTQLRLVEGDAVSELRGHTALTTQDGASIVATIKRDASGALVGKEQLDRSLQHADTRRAMDVAWRELGVTRVQDAPYGDVRMLD